MNIQEVYWPRRQSKCRSSGRSIDDGSGSIAHRDRSGCAQFIRLPICAVAAFACRVAAGALNAAPGFLLAGPTFVSDDLRDDLRYLIERLTDAGFHPDIRH